MDRPTLDAQLPLIYRGRLGWKGSNEFSFENLQDYAASTSAVRAGGQNRLELH
jgi:hypothetical protein